MPMTVATWNLFHGRSVPPTHRSLLGAFGDALADGGWDVCGLQEVPPWWAEPLAARTGAVAVAARTSLLRGWLPQLQRRVHERDPEILGVRGAAANVLLVRPGAGRIVERRFARLRFLPQGRTLQAVRIERPGGRGIWAANLHAHNRPPRLAEQDVARAFRIATEWAGDERLVVLGDLNLADVGEQAAAYGLVRLHGSRVDHVLGSGLRAAGGELAIRPKAGGVALSDHRLVAVRIQDAEPLAARA